MPAIVRPRREFSFADYAKNRPREPIPADRLDAQIQNLIDAIHSTQIALADIRRDDGRLKNQSVGPEQLAPKVGSQLADAIETATRINATRAEQGAAVVAASERTAQLFARDAESAAISAAEFLNAVNEARKVVDGSKDHITVLSDTIDAQTTDAENWATYAQSQASVAETNQEQAAAWAEYLAGPVVDPNEAPAYASGTPWGHGLYYQPVEGYGGNAGLWSAKWWAIYAAQLVGPWSFYYLGGWSDPPVPGSVNPDTGLKVPTPLPPGSFYYDTDTGTVYFWNGSAWVSPFALAAGITSRFVYLATAGQTAFSGPDHNSATPVVGTSPSDVHLNGVKLVPTLDYTIAGDVLTLSNIIVTAGSTVQWDLLVPPSQLTPGAVHAFKAILTPPSPDGSTTNFTMQYTHPTSGLQPVNVTDGSQLQVCLDGIVQEPGADYVATGNALTMAAAPPAGAHFWAVWLANEVLVT